MTAVGDRDTAAGTAVGDATARKLVKEHDQDNSSGNNSRTTVGGHSSMEQLGTRDTPDGREKRTLQR
jgi:hypothetical protein